MRLDSGLEAGSKGGHGPVRYRVVRHTPAREVAFAFTPEFPLEGEHRFDVRPGAGGGTILRHSLEGRPGGWMRIGWPLFFRWLHDALVEDALDRAEAEVAGRCWEPRALRAHVRLLRAVSTILLTFVDNLSTNLCS